MNTDLLSFLIIVAYLIMMLGITVWQGKRAKSKDATGFFLAGRGVSSVLLPLTMIAAMQSTFAFLGAPGMYYSHGISYIVIVLSQVWVALMVIYFGNKIRKLANKYNYMSIGDYFKDRYDSNYIKVLASIISVLMTMVFLAMQYVGNARAMQVITGNVVSYQVAIILCVLFSLAYVLIGGAGGVVLLDAIQAIVLMVGIVLAAYVAISPAGGIVNLFKTAIEKTPELLSRPGAQGMYTNKYWVMQFIVLPFGIWFCPHIWTRSLMAKDENALAKSAISIPVSQILIFGFSTLFIGLAGHQLLTDVQAADTVLPLMMRNYSNWFVAALIMAAAISAGMSTINSMLLVSSQIVSQDLILLKSKDKVSDSKNMIISRIVVFGLAILAAIIALKPPESLVQVVQDIAYTGLAQLAPAFILGLYWKGTRKEGAALGMTVGIILLFAMRIMQVSPLGYPGFMWAFFLNIIITVVVSLAFKSKDNTIVEEKFFSELRG
ncbi:sodium:solute symporter family protein [Paratissierella segnis]|jgi:SSS family solute:Na+ symporter|uniref:Sodium:solute symporter family protein n=1 Tax=Paratissierella segnis TaxID=2763679 RepID=A0A926EVG7_9FIRM|nr:sodium:solute symporter family protein [Paratissierella segnis]MBC8587209.1 sodium:solute symporter family protein [Paratissierella segnis]